jgi:DNA polymerase III epsilon subunit family exonuclease
MSTNLIAIDFETTGFWVKGGDAIVEIGAVKFNLDDGCISEFSKLVNPIRDIPWGATKIHGIKESDIINAKDINSVWAEFMSWAGNFYALVAHSAHFEKGFIKGFNPEAGNSLIFLDTLQLSRLTYKKLANHQLSTLCEHIGYQLENAHRALPDARATAHLFIDIASKNPKLIQIPKPTKSVVSVPPSRKKITKPIPDPSSYLNQYSGKERLEFSNGDVYNGEFEDGQRNGQGTYTYANGDVYVGEFEDDQRNGEGTYTFADGDVYVGEFEDDQRNGEGTYTFADGDVYNGEFEDGQFNGEGTYTFADGDVYVGEFEDDQRNGEGTYAYANGNVYVGEWRDGLRNGQGTLTYANGNVYVGEWRDGLQVAPFEKGEFEDEKIDLSAKDTPGLWWFLLALVIFTILLRF